MTGNIFMRVVKHGRFWAAKHIPGEFHKNGFDWKVTLLKPQQTSCWINTFSLIIDQDFCHHFHMDQGSYVYNRMQEWVVWPW